MSRTVGLSDTYMDSRRVMIFGLMSLVLHVFVFIALAVFPNLYNGHSDKFEPVYKVELVGELAPPPPPAPEEKGPATTTPPVATKPPKRVVPKKKVEAAKPAELVPLGKKKVEQEKETIAKLGTPKPSSKIYPIEPDKDIDEALAKIESKVKEKKKTSDEQAEKRKLEQAHLAKALDRVKKNVSDKVYGTGTGGMSGGTGKASANPLAIYYTKIWNRIRQNWTLPAQWKSGSHEAVVLLTIRSDGAITDFRFEKKSGNARFDQSVSWAVERSNPLPPLPSAAKASSLEVGVRFRPED